MNDILHDIKKLQEIKSLCYGFSRGTIESHIQDMIDEKQKQVADFEKTAPTDIQDLCKKIRGEF